MIETMRTLNNSRTAMIERQGGVYVITLEERRRLGSSVRTRRRPTKKEALAVAREWVRR